MKKAGLQLLGVIMSLLLISGYAAFIEKTSHSQQMKVGVTYMTMNNVFYRTIHTQIKKELDNQHYRVYIRDPELDEEKQGQQIEHFIKDGVEVIVINPVKSDSVVIVSALQKAQEKGIKIIAVDSPIGKDFVADCTIISDNYQAGVLLAKKMMETIDKGSIVLLEHPEAISAQDRIRGFTDTIKGKEEYQIVARRNSFGQTETGMPKMLEIMQEGIDFDVVMALNDRSVLGALAAFKEKNLQKNILIYSVDGSPDVKKLLDTTDDIQATVAQSPFAIGRQAARTIEMMSKGKKFEKMYTVPIEMITKENISKYDVTRWQ